MKTTMLFVITGLLLAGTANAERAAAVCKDDIKKFCADVKRGGGAIDKCLQQHEAELSAGCNQFRVAAKEKAKSFKEACASDVKTHCPDVKQGEGRIAACLKQNSDKLSPACKEQFAKPAK